METIYRQRAFGRWDYWIYCDYQRLFLGQRAAKRLISEGARLVTC